MRPLCLCAVLDKQKQKGKGWEGDVVDTENRAQDDSA